MKDIASVIIIGTIIANVFIGLYLMDSIKPPKLYKLLHIIGFSEILILGLIFIYFWFFKKLDVYDGKGLLVLICCFYMVTFAETLKRFEKNIKNAEQKGQSESKSSSQ